MKTFDYSKFSFFATNRPIVPGNVRAKKESIEKIGYIAECPIIVNKNMEIIDGQHRFMACKELGLPIIYAIHDNGVADDSVIIELNKNQQVWRLMEYVEHYAKKGVRFHSAVLEFESKYHLGISNALSICSRQFGSGDVFAKIRSGNNLALNERRNEIAAYLGHFKNLPFGLTIPFVRAIVGLYRKADDRQLAKLRRHYMEIPRCVHVPAYHRVFENIINRHVKDAKQLVIS